jgi:hypothetical protein
MPSCRNETNLAAEMSFVSASEAQFRTAGSNFFVLPSNPQSSRDMCNSAQSNAIHHKVSFQYQLSNPKSNQWRTRKRA